MSGSWRKPKVCISNIYTIWNSQFILSLFPAEEDKVISVLRLAKVAEDLLQSALDSIASTITLTLYEIAQQPQIVEKLQTEIKELNCENGQLQWEHLGDLKYLDMCITGEFQADTDTFQPA